MMVSTFLLSASILYNLTSAALLIFLTTAAWTRIIWIYLGVFTLLRCLCRTLVLIGSGYFCHLLTLYLLLYLYMIEKTNGILLNTRDHFIEHIKSGHLILNQRISLSVCL